jgi:uncharacterized protein YqgV (UPF0045/DUF77 family)
MLLAEAIREKDYIKESIDGLKEYIKTLMTVQDKTEFKINKTLIEGHLEELKELYKKFQQFSVTIARAKAKASIKVNDTKLSLLDAVVIRDTMYSKLNHFKGLLSHASFKADTSKSVLCIDMDELFKEIENIKVDIKTLDSEIEYAYWNLEVS